MLLLLSAPLFLFPCPQTCEDLVVPPEFCHIDMAFLQTKHCLLALTVGQVPRVSLGAQLSTPRDPEGYSGTNLEVGLDAIIKIVNRVFFQSI